MKINLNVTLEGINVQRFTAALRDANRAAGPPLTGDEMASALIAAILEDDAAEHGEPAAQPLHS